MAKYCMNCGYQMEDSAVFCMRCGLVENQGPHRISMGEMHDLLEMQGTTHEKMMSDMVLDFRTINNNVRRLTRAAAGSWTPIREAARWADFRDSAEVF